MYYIAGCCSGMVDWPNTLGVIEDGDRTNSVKALKGEYHVALDIIYLVH